MERFAWIAAGLNFMVTLLLLTAVWKWERSGTAVFRILPAALLGGVYAGLCLYQGFSFLACGEWQLVFLAAMSLVAFGIRFETLRKGAAFSVLWLAMHGLASGFDEKNLWTALLWGAVLMLLYLIGFDNGKGASFVPVRICHQGKTVHFKALRDTGNLLTDPVTGQSVLVVGPEIGHMLLGLTQQQLRTPVATIAQNAYPGLRLIPYTALGQPGGLLLAMRFADVSVGENKGGRIVAFAPDRIGEGRGFEALAGGMT